VSARHSAKSEAFAARAGLPFLSSGDLPSLVLSVLVNATPIGLDPGDGLPCDAALLRPGLFVLDAPYREGGTALVRAAREKGCEVVDGFALLLSQAAGQATLFSGRPASADDLLASLPAPLLPSFSPAGRKRAR
jgi:shikimate dehydrogenase